MSENNNNDNSARNSGVSVATVVQIVFIILKLCKIKPVKNWDWWIVMLPTEISIGVCVLVVCCVGGGVVCNICFPEKVQDDEVHVYNLTSDDSCESENTTPRKSIVVMTPESQPVSTC